MQIQSDSMKILVFSDANFYKIVRAAHEPSRTLVVQVSNSEKKMLVVSPTQVHNLLCNLVAAYVLAMLIL